MTDPITFERDAIQWRLTRVCCYNGASRDADPDDLRAAGWVPEAELAAERRRRVSAEARADAYRQERDEWTATERAAREAAEARVAELERVVEEVREFSKCALEKVQDSVPSLYYRGIEAHALGVIETIRRSLPDSPTSGVAAPPPTGSPPAGNAGESGGGLTLEMIRQQAAQVLQDAKEDSPLENLANAVENLCILLRAAEGGSDD